MQFDKKIQEDFNKVIAYSQGINNPKTDDLFERWMEAKKDFVEAMNGELIWEWPEKVSFELGAREKKMRVGDFICMVSDNWGNEDLADFIYVQQSGFFSNQVMYDYDLKDGAVIPKGMKLLKAFKYFESDIKVLNDIQSAASMIIQEDKIEGTLCLSVHPLDFLSTSENNHNWRSCHALDGEYKSGNLSYMVDKTTIICYLKSNKSEVLPNFPEDVLWNSKKWRVLLFFSDNWDILFAGRQYPFSSETGIDFVRERVLPVLHMGTWSNWTDKKIHHFDNEIEDFYFSDSYVPINNKLLKMSELIINNPGSLQFNDLLSSSCYEPMYCYKTSETWKGKRIVDYISTKQKIRVGGNVKCFYCGKQDIEFSETMLCNQCEIDYGSLEDDIFATCPNCGRRFIYDDGWFVDETEETICESCANDCTSWCPGCGQRYYTDNMKYDRKTDEWYCEYCLEDMQFDREERIY